MKRDTNWPSEITETALDVAQGGASKAKEVVRSAGLQSDGELVQAKEAGPGTKFWDTLPPD